MAESVEFTLNGKPVSVAGDERRSLLSVLRDVLGLTGTKYGCGEGQCGACTVLVDGEPRRSCVTEMSEVWDAEVTTIEGFELDGELHPLQQAFLEAGAMQCAFCTSGMIVSGAALLEKYRTPNREQIIRFMQGNICRCGTYGRIIVAIERAAAGRMEAQNG